MRNESILDLNLSTADASTPDGIVHFGRFFDMGGDAETEVVILNDGDESLSLNYNNIELLEDMYVGDMVMFRSYLVRVGNTSRDVVIEGYKVATPASRAGKVNAKPGDMVWFDEPRLFARETCRLVVKKERQRGRQPDGIVKDPWIEVEY
jgi:3-aminobutyryl-CoA ammonia-lyase